jgi:hypothetical protein
MKDYFDLWILACHTDFEGDILCQAVRSTFGRRKTMLLAQLPFGLTEAFAQDAQKQVQWQAFLRKNKLDALALEDVVSQLAVFMQPVVDAASTHQAFSWLWQAGGPWRPTSPS